LSVKAIGLIKFKDWLISKQPKENSKVILESIKLNKSKIENVQNLLEQSRNEQQSKLNKILEEVDSIDDNLFKHSWSNEEILGKVSEIQEILDKIDISDIDKDQILKKVNDSETTLKHKLKIVIPLFYKFLVYEGELEISNKQNLPESIKE